MSSTIRTYRHSPTQAADPTGTLVDTEVDADDGAFTVTVDTTGWSAGSYQVSVTREYTTGGLSESAKSNPLDVTASVSGYSDNFNDASDPTPVLLATHNSAWVSLHATEAIVSMCQTNGSGHVQPVTSVTANLGARYTGSDGNLSRVVLAPYPDNLHDSYRGPVVRADGTNYYRARIYGNFDFIAIEPVLDGTHTSDVQFTDISSYGYDATVAHEVLLTAATVDTDDVYLEVSIDGVVRSSGTATFESGFALLTVGTSGFWGDIQGNPAYCEFESWQDT